MPKTWKALLSMSSPRGRSRGAVLHGARIVATQQVHLGAEGIALAVFGSKLHHAVEEGEGAVVVFACHRVASQPHIRIGVAFVELLHLLVVAVGEVVATHLVVEIAALLVVVFVVGHKADGRAEIGESGCGVGEFQVDERAFGLHKGKCFLVFLRQMLAAKSKAERALPFSSLLRRMRPMKKWA